MYDMETEKWIELSPMPHHLSNFGKWNATYVFEMSFCKSILEITAQCFKTFQF